MPGHLRVPPAGSAEACLPGSGCSPTRGGCPIPGRRWRACRAASPAWFCAMTASRGAQRSDATWRGSVGHAALPWWWPGISGWPPALGAGVHLRAGRWPGVLRRRHLLITSSAHGRADLLGAPRRRRTGLPVPRLSDAEPSRSRRSRTSPLDAPCSRRAPAGCGARRHRRRRRPAPAAPHLPGRGSDRRPRLTAMCLFDHSVSRLP